MKRNQKYPIQIYMDTIIKFTGTCITKLINVKPFIFCIFCYIECVRNPVYYVHLVNNDKHVAVFFSRMPGTI